MNPGIFYFIGAALILFGIPKSDRRFKTGHKGNATPNIILIAAGALMLLATWGISSIADNGDAKGNITVSEPSTLRTVDPPTETAAKSQAQTLSPSQPSQVQSVIPGEAAEATLSPPETNVAQQLPARTQPFAERGAGAADETANATKDSEQDHTASNSPSEVEKQFTGQYGKCMSDATATVDMVNCNGAETNVQDAVLNATYKRVMQILMPDDQKSLRLAEREWIKERDRQCALEAEEYGAGSFASVAHGGCYLRMVVERRLVLEKMERH